MGRRGEERRPEGESRGEDNRGERRGKERRWEGEGRGEAAVRPNWKLH